MLNVGEQGMSKFFSIGTLSKATGVPVSTLRYYSNKGLLVPTKTNKETNYRYYDEYQFWNVEFIKMCRDVNIPVDAIRDVLVNQDTDLMLRSIDDASDTIYKEMMRCLIALKDLAWLKERASCREKNQKNAICICPKPARTVLMATSNSDGERNYELQMLSRKLLEHRQTIKRCYGYSLDMDELFKRGNSRVVSKYLEIDSYEYQYVDTKNLFTIPEGTYLTAYAKAFHSEFDISYIKEYMSNNGYEPEMVTVSSASVPFLDWREICYEINILLK